MKLNGKQVRERRERLALSIEDICAKAHVSPHTWVRAEHGDEVRPSSVRRIAEALGVEPGQLLGGPVPLGENLAEVSVSELLTMRDDLQAALAGMDTGLEAMRDPEHSAKVLNLMDRCNIVIAQLERIAERAAAGA